MKAKNVIPGDLEACPNRTMVLAIKSEECQEVSRGHINQGRNSQGEGLNL
jgi:hypothetical protein